MKTSSLLKQPYKFALVGGIFYGLTLFLLTLISVVTGYGQGFLSVTGGIYPGYKISFAGSFVGLFFGFIDGFIISYLVAFLGGKEKKQIDKKDNSK
jgi:hypothetical protein